MAKYKGWLKFPVVGFFGFLFLMGLALTFPVSVEAGPLSFITQFLAGKEVPTVPSRQFNSQVMPVLQAAVNLDPNPAKGGGDIVVVDDSALLPDVGPSGTAADIPDASSGNISLYVVRKGDTLNGVAQLFGVSPNTILWANDLNSRLLKEGQMLTILPISGVKHVVVRGDTFSSLAKKYKADASEIAKFNDLSADAVLAVGTTVIVPDGVLANSSASVTSVYRGGGGPAYEGYYLRPTLGSVRTQGLHGYNGVDLASYLGAPILASAEGTVIVARNSGWNGGYGNYVVITHGNGTQTLYAHLQGLSTWVGQRVVQGQVIGYMGATGKATGVHLHFEVRGARNPF